MAINVPIKDEEIRADTFGAPVANEVNRLTLVTAVSAWTNVPLLAGWTQYATSPLMYRKVGDNVSVRGRIEGAPSGAWIPFAQLPAGFRVPKEIIVATSCIISAAWTVGNVLITPDGNFAGSVVAQSWGINLTYSITP